MRLCACLETLIGLSALLLICGQAIAQNTTSTILSTENHSTETEQSTRAQHQNNAAAPTRPGAREPHASRAAPTPMPLEKTFELLQQALPGLGDTISKGQRLTPQQNKVLTDFVKQLGSTISELPNMLQRGNSTLNLTKLLQNSNLLQALMGSNTPEDPGSKPYTVDWLKCRMDLLLMARGVTSREMWALQMLDSWGKPEMSILKGNTVFLGNNAECRNVHYTNTKTYANVQGNICRMSIYLEATRGLMPGSGDIVPFYMDLCLPRSCQTEDLNKALTQNGTQRIIATCTADLDIGEDPWAIVAVIVLGIFLALMVAGTLAEFCARSRPLRTANLINAFVPSSLSEPTSNGVSSITFNGGMGKQNGHINEVYEMSETPKAAGGEDLAQNYPYRKSAGDPNWLIGSSSLLSGKRRIVLPKLAREEVKKPKDAIAHLSKWHRFLLSFSLPRNAGKILGVKSGPGSISCLHGIRVFSMAWVILGHVIIFSATSSNFKNKLSILQLEETLLFQTIINAPLSVDSFFFMSGLLTAYLFLKECGKKEKVTARQGILYYVHRYWRLTPPMMIWIMVVACLVKYVGEGKPGWVDYPGAQVCRDNWWLNMLYIQTFWVERMGCLGVTWFLSNDMVFYILAPLVMIPWVYRQRVLGHIMAAMLLVIHLATNAWLVYEYNFDILRNNVEYSNKLYFRPWARSGPFAVGLVFGYILYRTKCKLHMNKFLVVVGWLLALGFMFTVTLVTYNENKNVLSDPEGWSVWGKVVYEMLCRPCWALMLGWIVLACSTGHGGFINSILSWEGFLPLSRLTYCAFLVHMTVMTYEFSAPESTMLFIVTNLVYRFFGMYVMSYAVAFLLAVGVEAPMLGIEKVMLSR